MAHEQRLRPSTSWAVQLKAAGGLALIVVVWLAILPLAGLAFLAAAGGAWARGRIFTSRNGCGRARGGVSRVAPASLGGMVRDGARWDPRTERRTAG